MNTSCWLRINSRGTINATKTKPQTIGVDEISLQLSLEIPDKLFEKPHLQATMKIPDEAIMPTTITPEVTDNLAEAIKTTTGLDMIIKIKEPEPEFTSRDPWSPEEEDE